MSLATSSPAPGTEPASGDNRHDYLADPSDPAAAAWVDEQDARARDYLDDLAEHEPVRRRLAELLGAPWRGAPVVTAGLRLELRRDAGAAQPSLWLVRDGREQLLVDADELSDDGSVTISAFSAAPDGSLVAWASATGGSDWLTIRFRDPETGVDLPDELNWIKWPELAWIAPDRLAYMAFAQPANGHELTAANSGAEVRLHRIGRPQSDDVVIHRPARTTWVVPTVSADRRWLIVQEQAGIVPATVLIRPADLSGPWRTVLDGPGPMPVLGMHGDDLVVLDFQQASNGEVVAVSTQSGERRILVAEGAAAIDHYGAHLVDGCVLTVRHMLTGSVVTVNPLDGGPGWQIPLPEDAIVRDVSCSPGGKSAYLEVEEVAGPRSIVRHDVSDQRTEVEYRADYRAPGQVMVHTVTATSGDGTAVPMRVVRLAGPEPRGTAKVLLSVYGGYSVPFACTGYASWHLPWLEAGGVLAYAGIRGGGEYGEQWHLAATTTNKQRGIDDLIACVEFFSEQGWAAPRQVAINGMSNGGLLVGTVVTQRPELLGAAIPEVGVMDMLRFHLYTAGHGWVREFGSVDVPQERAALAAYSPLHRIGPGRLYPPTLVLAADRDDRVPPGPHSYRFTALLQDAQAADHPVLLRVARNAGHAAGRTLTERVAERAAVLAFAAHALDLPLADRSTPHPSNNETNNRTNDEETAR